MLSWAQCCTLSVRSTQQCCVADRMFSFHKVGVRVERRSLFGTTLLADLEPAAEWKTTVPVLCPKPPCHTTYFKMWDVLTHFRRLLQKSFVLPTHPFFPFCNGASDTDTISQEGRLSHTLGLGSVFCSSSSYREWAEGYRGNGTAVLAALGKRPLNNLHISA